MTNTQENKSMFTVETKSLLAKLMATENIRVEHHNTKTARFNLKTRTLTCPVWKNMNGDLYDLLMGHEISHALRTPAEGWHDSVVYAGGDKKASPEAQQAFKNFLNVVEDARIEKLVKRQYPGLKRPMINGYKDLLARDFFGLSAISDYNELYLIDKLNLAAKCGSLVNIRFSGKEKVFYDALMATETWDEVVALAKKLYEYSKTEQKDAEEKKRELSDILKETYEDFDEEFDYVEGEESKESEELYGEESDSDSDDESSEDSDSKDSDSESDEEDEKDDKDGKTGKGRGDKAKDEEEKADDVTTEEKADKGRGNRAQANQKNEESKSQGSTPSHGAGALEGENEFVPKARTDEHFRQSENSLIEENNNVQSVYVNIPTPILKNIVVPASVVNENFRKSFKGYEQHLLKGLNEFKRRNDDYVSLLAKEFEMKKAARSYAKAKISDSGDIDVNKLASYRLEDNIFRKMLQLQKGKSHGLVLILDKSGSMSEHIEGAMEQILVMALFCRKVNIPFVAYNFTNKVDGINAPQFSKKKNNMQMGGLTLREMFNSKMSASDFTQAMANHLYFAKALSRTNDVSVSSLPYSERMGSTPLNESLVALRDIIRSFKKSYRLDIVNAIVVHDGDSDGNYNAYESDSEKKYDVYRFNHDSPYTKVTLVDQTEKLSIPVSQEYRGLTIALMKWLQMTAQCGVFGFYIVGHTKKRAKEGINKLYQNKQGIAMNNRAYRDTNSIILLDKLCQEVIDEKFLESYTTGYTRLYFIPGGTELQIGDGTIQNTGKTWTPSRLLSAFKKVNRKKQISRVLVNRFIALMAV